MKKYPKARVLFVISAPSGCGKTTLCKKLLEDNPGLALSISTTTRAPRPEEKDGVDYNFVSEKKFSDTVGGNGFLEYEGNFGKLYGTPRKFIEQNLKKARPVILNIDVKGAVKIQKKYPAESVLIFILPPSVKALKKRLKGRKSDTPADIKKRLGLAKKEMEHKNRYDYRVVNDRIDSAYKRLKKIINEKIKERKVCE